MNWVQVFMVTLLAEDLEQVSSFRASVTSSVTWDSFYIIGLH